MVSFLLALQFLTIIPLRIKDADEQKIAGAVVYFPLVGLLIGLLLCGIYFCLTALHFSTFTSAIILVVSLIAITGGLHLDGLSDSADAFLSHKPKDEMLAIMRDPHIGVMGVLSIIVVLLLKIGLFYSIATPLKVTSLLLMCILSRWGAVQAMFLFPYARQNGKAGVFIRGLTRRMFFLTLISTCALALLVWQLQGLIILLIASGCVYLAGRFSYRKIGGITGDTLGALIELTESFILFFICIIGGKIYG